MPPPPARRLLPGWAAPNGRDALCAASDRTPRWALSVLHNQWHPPPTPPLPARWSPHAVFPLRGRRTSRHAERRGVSSSIPAAARGLLGGSRAACRLPHLLPLQRPPRVVAVTRRRRRLLPRARCARALSTCLGWYGWDKQGTEDELGMAIVDWTGGGLARCPLMVGVPTAGWPAARGGPQSRVAREGWGVDALATTAALAGSPAGSRPLATTVRVLPSEVAAEVCRQVLGVLPAFADEHTGVCDVVVLLASASLAAEFMGVDTTGRAQGICRWVAAESGVEEVNEPVDMVLAGEEEEG